MRPAAVLNRLFPALMTFLCAPPTLIVAYIALAVSVDAGPAVSERHLGAVRRENVPQALGYVEILAIDATNQSARLRISFAPGPALQGRRHDVPDRELRVEFGNGEQVEDFVFRAQEPIPPTSFEVDLNDGTVADDPFDRFKARLGISVHEASGAPVSLPVTTRVRS